MNNRKSQSFLAEEEDEEESQESEVKEDNTPIKVVGASFGSREDQDFSLATVPVDITNPENQKTIEINALLDNGNSVTLISEEAAKALGLVGHQNFKRILGIGGKSVASHIRGKIVVSSQDGTVREITMVRVVPNPTGNLKAVDWNKHKHKFGHLKNLEFPTPCERRSVDIILGNCTGNLIMSMGKDIHGLNADDPVAKETPLGWVVAGKVNPSTRQENLQLYMSFFVQEIRAESEAIGASNDKTMLQSQYSVADYECLCTGKKRGITSYKKDNGASPNLGPKTGISLSTRESNGALGSDEDTRLSELVEAQCAVEETSHDERKTYRKDEQRAVDLLKEQGKYENRIATMPCLWKEGEPKLRDKMEQSEEEKKPWTKRRNPSFYASLFDMLGLITPVDTAGRIAFQHLWTKDYGWDDSVWPNKLQEWLQWMSSVPDFPKFKIPRCHIDPENQSEIPEEERVNPFYMTEIDAAGPFRVNLGRGNKMNRWTTQRRDVQVGDIVAVLEDKTRGVWPLGKIIKVFHGEKDNHSRNAQVQCQGRTLDCSLTQFMVVQEAPAQS